MPVTEKQAKEMWEAIEVYLAKKANDDEQTRLRLIADEETNWFNTLGIDIQGAPDRDTALDNYNQIKTLLKNETNGIRKQLLKLKLAQADEKFKNVKKGV